MKKSNERRRPHILKIFAIVVIGALAVTAFVVAEYTSSSQLWRLTLNAQMQKDKRCRIDDMLEGESKKLDGALIVEGRVRCTDGREFKFSRSGSQPKFKLEVCTTSSC